MAITRCTRALLQLFVLALAVLLSRPAAAQTERSGGGSANAQLYQDYQQAVTERTQLRADNAKLKSDLSDTKDQLAALKRQLAAAQAGAANSQAAVATAQAAQANTAKNLETLKAQALQLVARFRDTITQLRGVELDRAQLQRDLAQSKSAFDQCASANYQLYQVDNEVLDRYSHQGAFSYLARAEPFTRIERTRVDNLVLEYRERAEALRVQPRAGAAPGGGGGASAPTGNLAPASTPAAPGSVTKPADTSAPSGPAVPGAAGAQARTEASGSAGQPPPQ